MLGAKIGTLEQTIRKVSGDSSSLFTPSQLLLDNYASAKVDEDLRLHKFKEVIARNGESSESNRSYLSSEYETQSTSDLSSELKQFNFIKIINDVDDDNDVLSYYEGNGDSHPEIDDQPTILPPDIQKFVDEAMKNSEHLDIQSKTLTEH